MVMGITDVDDKIIKRASEVSVDDDHVDRVSVLIPAWQCRGCCTRVFYVSLSVCDPARMC